MVLLDSLAQWKQYSLWKILRTPHNHQCLLQLREDLLLRKDTTLYSERVSGTFLPEHLAWGFVIKIQLNTDIFCLHHYFLSSPIFPRAVKCPLFCALCHIKYTSKIKCKLGLNWDQCLRKVLHAYDGM